MEKPKIAGETPVRIECEAGKTYAWCSCGLSEKQPFCDGSHKEGPFRPKVWTSEENTTKSYCMCKMTQDPNGYCDGSHKSIA